MIRHARLLGATALLTLSSACWPQAAPHSAHGSTAPRTAEPKSEKPPQGRPASGGLYRSAFEDYRGFTPDEPLVDWRGANDRVRETGGHIGLLKGAQGQGAAAAGHQGHGGKPAAEPKK
jgi:hypothetical protein